MPKVLELLGRPRRGYRRSVRSLQAPASVQPDTGEGVRQSRISRGNCRGCGRPVHVERRFGRRRRPACVQEAEASEQQGAHFELGLTVMSACVLSFDLGAAQAGPLRYSLPSGVDRCLRHHLARPGKTLRGLRCCPGMLPGGMAADYSCRSHRNIASTVPTLMPPHVPRLQAVRPSGFHAAAFRPLAPSKPPSPPQDTMKAPGACISFESASQPLSSIQTFNRRYPAPLWCQSAPSLPLAHNAHSPGPHHHLKRLPLTFRPSRCVPPFVPPRPSFFPPA